MSLTTLWGQTKTIETYSYTFCRIQTSLHALNSRFRFLIQPSLLFFCSQPRLLLRGLSLGRCLRETRRISLWTILGNFIIRRIDYSKAVRLGEGATRSGPSPSCGTIGFAVRLHL